MISKSKRRFVLFAFMVLSATAVSGVAAPNWKRLESENFEMFTTASAGKGREILNHFERTRSFFLQISKRSNLDSVPVRIIVLNSKKDWERYRIRENAGAYYAPGLVMDYIIMGDVSEQAKSVATHEFTHLFVERSGMKLPLWLNEGMAELFSVMRPTDKDVKVGAILVGRGLELAITDWMDLSTLFGVDEKSQFYNDKKHTGIFYAQSWLLTHMLFLDESFRHENPAFLNAITSGQDTQEAIGSAFGISLEHLETALKNYYMRERLHSLVFPVELPKKHDKADAVAATPLQQSICEALLLAFVDRKEEALNLLDDLADKHPDNLELAEAQAEVAWHNNEIETGAHHAERALALGSNNPSLKWNYAQFMTQMDVRADKLPALIREIVQQNPANLESLVLLLEVLSARGEYEEVIKEAKSIKRMEPGLATRLFTVLAGSYWMAGDKQESRIALARAKEYAKTPEDDRRCQAIEEFMEQSEYAMRAREELRTAKIRQQPDIFYEESTSAENPAESAYEEPSEAELEEWALRQLTRGAELDKANGFLQALECRGETAVLVAINSDGETLRLLVDDPLKVSIRGIASKSFEFVCGPQKQIPVVMEFIPNNTEDVTGVLRVLRFLETP